MKTCSEKKPWPRYFVKSPQPIRAWKWIKGGDGPIKNGLYVAHEFDARSATMETKSGLARLESGDMILEDIDGDFYPCAIGVFLRTYEEVES